VFFLKIALQDQFFSLMGVVIPLDLANNTTHLKKTHKLPTWKTIRNNPKRKRESTPFEETSISEITRGIDS